MTAARQFHEDGTLPPSPHWVFVFGSNLLGNHGAGAAKAALAFGAVQGFSHGRAHSSYAIPTKDTLMRTRSLKGIALAVDVFVAHARENRHENFFVTRVGCGLAGLADKDVAPLFANAPVNCSFAEEWRDLIGEPFIGI